MNPQGFIWAGLKVEDLSKSVNFYQDILGLKLKRQGADFALFDAGGGGLLELFIDGKGYPGIKTGEQQSLIVGFRVQDLVSAIVELKSRGVEFIEEMGEYKSTRWVKFVDWEGNVLELKEIP